MFDLISSEYGWDDEIILDKTLKRLRQITASIAERKLTARRENRLIASWQTRSLAMVMASTSGSEDLMKFAANLTIDSEEYEQFNKEKNFKPVKQNSKLVVHATTQEEAVGINYNAAADNNNSSELLALFGQKLESGKPGH